VGSGESIRAGHGPRTSKGLAVYIGDGSTFISRRSAWIRRMVVLLGLNISNPRHRHQGGQLGVSNGQDWPPSCCVLREPPPMCTQLRSQVGLLSCTLLCKADLRCSALLCSSAACTTPCSRLCSRPHRREGPSMARGKVQELPKHTLAVLRASVCLCLTICQSPHHVSYGSRSQRRLRVACCCVGWRAAGGVLLCWVEGCGWRHRGGADTRAIS
jgi:hypothetical protein